MWQNVIPSRFISELPNEEITITSNERLLKNFKNNYSDFEFDQDYENNNFYNNKISKTSGLFKNEKLRFNQNNLLTKKTFNFKVGDRVFHSKFGMGIINDLNENKANVDFDKAE